MKIAWYTPLHDRSAIARGSASVIRALHADGHQVRVVRSELDSMVDSQPALPLPAGVSIQKPGDWSGLAPTEHDAFVYQVGDSHPNHARALQPHNPRGVVVLHDMALNGLLQSLNPSPDELFAAMAREASPELVEPLAARWRVGKDERRETLYSVPAWQFAVRRATGIVVHSQAHRRMVRERFGGPVIALPLHWSDRPGPIQLPEPVVPQVEGRPLRLLTFGLINWNKCVDRVLRVLAETPILRETCEYVVLGAAESPGMDDQLERLARNGGVRMRRVPQFVEEQELQREIAAADVVLCLRQPVLEGGSASALTAMAAGKPVVVVDEGAYADFPEGTVWHVPAGDVEQGLAAALRHLMEHPEERQRMGERARAHVLAVHDPASYAQQLADFLREVAAIAPVLETVDNLAAHAKRTALFSTANTTVMSEAIASLFHPNPDDERYVGRLDASGWE